MFMFVYVIPSFFQLARCALWFALSLVFSELRIMTWPMISQDAAVCKERLSLVGQLLQDYLLLPVQKFDQLAILMEKFELDDWAKMETRWYAKHAALRPEERCVGLGQQKFNGLPGLAVVGNFAAPGAASSAAQAALLSSGGSALVAPPQTACITLQSQAWSPIEANNQQALAKAALAQAALQKQLERDLAQLG